MTATPSQLLSIVLPAFDEQAVLDMTFARFAAALPAVCAPLGLDFELIFVNDGSRDRTAAILDGFTTRDARVRVVHLARNFGHQAAITAGMNVARGDVIAIMDCDLQDPPEVLPRFLAAWRDGNQVVFAVRRKRKEWIGKRAAYWAFYRLLAAISDLQIPLDSGDFCVMDRSALDLLNSLPERQRFVRGLRTWVGLKQHGVEYDRDARAAGVPQYTFSKLIALAMDGLVSFSSVPLRVVTRLGILSALLALMLGAWIAGVTLWEWQTGTPSPAPRGWASLACLVLVMSSAQMISLGIIGEYLARVFLEVKGRPTYLIARIVGGGGENPRRRETDRPAAPSSDRPPRSDDDRPVVAATGEASAETSAEASAEANGATARPSAPRAASLWAVGLKRFRKDGRSTTTAAARRHALAGRRRRTAARVVDPPRTP